MIFDIFQKFLYELFFVKFLNILRKIFRKILRKFENTSKKFVKILRKIYPHSEKNLRLLKKMTKHNFTKILEIFLESF